jgi:hypothetical protein
MRDWEFFDANTLLSKEIHKCFASLKGICMDGPVCYFPVWLRPPRLDQVHDDITAFVGLASSSVGAVVCFATKVAVSVTHDREQDSGSSWRWRSSDHVFEESKIARLKGGARDDEMKWLHIKQSWSSTHFVSRLDHIERKALGLCKDTKKRLL